jgi:hypothetical protein
LQGAVKVNFPDLGSVVGRTSCKVFNVRREEDTRYVSVVGGKLGHSHDLCLFAVLEQLPDKDFALASISLHSEFHWEE